MGRKSRKKRERRGQKSGEVEISPSVLIRREGRYLHVQNVQSNHEAAIIRQRQSVLRMPKQIQDQVDELRKCIRSLPTLQLLAFLALKVACFDPETYKESELEHTLMDLEYPTWLAVLEPNPKEQTDLTVVEDNANFLRKVVKLRNSVLRYYAREWMTEGIDRPTGAHDIQFLTRAQELNVRNPGYHHHLLDILRRLFQDIDGPLVKMVGFTILEAITLLTAVEETIQGALSDWRKAARNAVDETVSKLEAYKATKEPQEGIPQHSLDYAESSTQTEIHQYAENLAIGWYWFGIESAWVVTSEGLAQKTGLSRQTVKAFLDQFSLEFGQRSIADDWPGRYEPLVKAPILRLGADRYFASLATDLPWAIKPNLEDLLKTSPSTWQTYQDQRARFLESETLSLLSRCLPGAQIYNNLSYSQRGEDNQINEFELDGLIIYDSVLLLVEAKAGQMSSPARRGAPSITEDLKSLVGEAHEQAMRAQRYVLSAPDVEFVCSNGQHIRLRNADYNRIILITTALDDLTVFTTRLIELAKLGVLSEEQLPWAVTLMDLQVISEIVEFGPQLIHYIQRRDYINKSAISAFDELDYFSHYLQFGLGFQSGKGDYEDITIMSHTEPFDKYFLYRMGFRKTRAPKPRQILSPKQRTQIRRIVDDASPGFVDRVCRILDNWEAKKAKVHLP